MAEVTMAEARYVAPDGREQVVQLPGTVLRDGNVRYDASVHKGHLHCAHCDAKVNFDPGSEVVAGGLRGPSAHFQLNAKQKHSDDCLMPLRINEGRAAKDYDTRLGYRIHLNTRDYSELFNDAAYPYERDENKKLILKDERLRKMEAIGVATIEDLLRVMRRGDYERLNKSVVIQCGSVPVAWPDFFIRYSRNGGAEHRFIGLVESLQARRNQPVLMEIFNEKAVYMRDLFDRAQHGESKRIEYAGNDGRKHVIVPRVWLDNRNDTYVTSALSLPGAYLVLGHPRLKTVVEGGVVTHYLNVSVTDRRQIAAVNIDEIAQKARANHAKREPGVS